MRFKEGDEVNVVGALSEFRISPGDVRIIRHIDYEDDGMPYQLNCGTWAMESELMLKTDAHDKNGSTCATCGQAVEEEALVDVDERIDVNMSLKQISLIYGVFGQLSDEDAVHQAQKSELVGKHIQDSDIWDELTFHLYRKLDDTLRDAGVIVDEL